MPANEYLDRLPSASEDVEMELENTYSRLENRLPDPRNYLGEQYHSKDEYSKRGHPVQSTQQSARHA